MSLSSVLSRQCWAFRMYLVSVELRSFVNKRNVLLWVVSPYSVELHSCNSLLSEMFCSGWLWNSRGSEDQQTISQSQRENTNSPFFSLLTRRWCIFYLSAPFISVFYFVFSFLLLYTDNIALGRSNTCHSTTRQRTQGPRQIYQGFYIQCVI